MYNYKELCPNFWKNFCDGNIPENGAGTYLDTLMQMNQDRHKALHDKLQMPEGVWKYEEQTETRPRSTYDLSTKLLLAALPEDEQDKVNLFNNKLLNGMKISKYLSKVDTRELAGRLFPILTTVKDSLGCLNKELPKLPRDMRDPFNLISNFNVLVQNFYSEVAASQNVMFGISLFMPDFLEAANSSSFSSCYTVGGCNERAPFHLSYTSNTFVLYVRSSGAKPNIIGRCWGMVNADFTQIVVFRPYGFINEDHISSAVWWMINKIAGENNILNWVEWEAEDSEDGSGIMNLYSDNGMWNDPVIKIFSCTTRDSTLFYQSRYSVQTSPCPICGNVHNNNTIVCSICNAKYIKPCMCCGKHVIFLKGDVTICSTCMKGEKTCPHCGKTFPEKMDECPFCHWDYHCSWCGHTSDVPLYRVGAVGLCRECKDILLSTTCDVCGATGDMYPYEGLAMCSKCFSFTTAFMVRGYNADIMPKGGHKKAIEAFRRCRQEARSAH